MAQEDITDLERVQKEAGRAAFEAGCQATREALAGKCGELFPSALSITLEIGCGHGHFLTAYSLAHPDKVCVGVDLITRRVKRGQNKSDKRGLEKLHFIKAEALEFLDALPAHVELERTFVLFPDPWPKKRHWKNRIVQQPLLEKLAARTRPGAMLYLQQDHADYFRWMQEQVAASPLWEPKADAEWPFEAPSYFQDLMDGWQSLVAVRTGSD